MYTYGGDANLNGMVNGDDYFAIDSHITASGSAFGFTNGDFNYDGAIDGDDYFIIDSNIAAQGSSLFIAGFSPDVTAVPEPAGLAILGGLMMFSARRRSRV